MARKKLQHFAEMKSFPCLFEVGFDSDPSVRRGHWADYFNNGSSLVVELGCGRGVYTLELAARFPERNFIGVDIKGSRLWHGCRALLDQGISNAAFVRARVEQLDSVFASEEVSEVWVTFPDPHPALGRAKRRLTAPRYLELYERWLKDFGVLHVKTDHLGFFEYSLEQLKMRGWTLEVELRDVHRVAQDPVLTEIKTTYERRHLAEGRTIYYLRARRP